MLDIKSIYENTSYEFRLEFVAALLILNALYWQQCDEDTMASLPENYSTSLLIQEYGLFNYFQIDNDTIPHFQDLNNVQRINSWHDMYVCYIEAKKPSEDNCLLDAAKFSLLAILVACVENEVKLGASIQSKVDKFSRRIAFYGYQLLIYDGRRNRYPAEYIYLYFPLVFEEACSLIPLEYEVCTEGETKEFGTERAIYFSLPREELIEKMRSMSPRQYGDFLYENVPSSECDREAISNLMSKYGDEHYPVPRDFNNENMHCWGELFDLSEFDGHLWYPENTVNDINSLLEAVKRSVEQINRESEEESPGEYILLSVDYLSVKDYANSQLSLPRQQAMLRLVQLVLYKLYVGESFKIEDVKKLDDIVTPLRTALSVQSALTLAAYRCGVLMKRLQIQTCPHGSAAIAELFPKLSIFFNRVMTTTLVKKSP